MTPEDSVTARVLVHEAVLDGTTLTEEPFIRQGQGSAFVSRGNELVVLSVSASGLAALQAKVGQLVEKGFHSIIVSLAGIKTLDREALKLLLKARSFVENWAGFLRLCDVGPELAQLVRALNLEKDLSPAGTKAEAIERWKAEVTGAPLPAASPAPAAEGPLKLDWAASPSAAPDDGAIRRAPKKAAASAPVADKDLPAVEVAELVVPAEDLPKLKRQVEGVISRGKKYVTMRLHFKKRMRSEDVTILTDVRNLLNNAGGQLVLASLQQDVATWLKLLDYDREFVIAEDADQAELLHKRHAAGGGKPAGSKTATALKAVEPPFSVVGRQGDNVTIRPRGSTGGRATRATVSVLEVTRTTLPGLVAEVERVTSNGARDLLLDVKPLEGLRGDRVEPLSEAVALAQVKGARVQVARVGRELRAFLKIVGLEGKLPLNDDQDGALLALAASIHAKASFDELQLVLEKAPPAATAVSVGASDVNASSITFESDDDVTPVVAPPIESATPAANGEASRAEVERLQAELSAVRARQQAAETERQSLERRAAEAERKLAELDATTRRATMRLQETDAAKGQAEKRLLELEAERTTVVSARDAALADVTASRESARRASEEAERLRGELEAARAETARAQELARAQQAGTADRAQLEGEIARLQGEAAKAAEKIDFLEARLREADYSKTEAGHIARSSDEARRRFEAQVEAAEAEAARAKELASDLEARLKEMESHATAFRQAAESERQREKGELEARVRAHETRIKELEQRALAAPATGDAQAGLAERVAKLEREKAEILLESKREIERLTREQEALREELESAGEMIERLGKELELT